MEEEDEQQAPSRSVVEPGRNDRQRRRAHREEGKGEMTLGRARDPEKWQMPQRRDHPDQEGRPQHPGDGLYSLQQVSAPSKLFARRSSDEKDEEKGGRNGDPTGRIGQVGDGAPFQDVN